jgi:outer membrane protein TolC
MRLATVNAENDLERARTNLKRSRMNLYSLLRLPSSLEIELVLPDNLPELELDPERCVALAKENNPEMLQNLQQRLEADRQVEYAKRSSQFSANLNASFGLNQQANELNAAYRNPLDQEIVKLGLSIPIVDWGLSKGQYRLAERQREVAELTARQSELDFEQTVLLKAEEFNQQDKIVNSAAQADTIAALAYDITRERFLMGYVDLLRLNVAQSSGISAKRSYIDALESYWASFYEIRRMTLYDFVREEELGHFLLE